MSIPGLMVIGERINPGFRSTKALFDEEDFSGIKSLAVKQAKAGASYLNVNAGSKALDTQGFLPELIRSIQAVVDLPLSIDCSDPAVLTEALQAYDADKAHGQKPIINSIAASRWELKEVLKVRPCKVVLMSSERFDDGQLAPCRTGEEVRTAAREMVSLLKAENPNMQNDDFFIDVSICTLAADAEGLVKMALDGIRLIHDDTELSGAHIMGGLSNLPQYLPAEAVDGSDLKHQLECAFLTIALPMGFNTVLGTPWRNYQLLPVDNYVLNVFKEIVELREHDALMSVVRLYDKNV